MNGLTLMEWLNDVDDRYKKEADIFYRKAPGQPRPLRKALQVLGYAAGAVAAIAVTVGLLWLGQLQKPPTGPVHAAASSTPSPEPTQAPSAAPSPAPSNEPSSSVSVPSLTAEEILAKWKTYRMDEQGRQHLSDPQEQALYDAFVEKYGADFGDDGEVKLLMMFPVYLGQWEKDGTIHRTYFAECSAYTLAERDDRKEVYESRSGNDWLDTVVDEDGTLQSIWMPGRQEDSRSMDSYVGDREIWNMLVQAHKVWYSEGDIILTREHRELGREMVVSFLEQTDRTGYVEASYVVNGQLNKAIPEYLPFGPQESTNEASLTPEPNPTSEPTPSPTPMPTPEESAELDPEILTQGAAALVTQYLEGRYESENARVPLAELYVENVHVYQSTLGMDAIAVGFRVVLRPENPDDWEKLMVGNAKPGTGDKEGCVTQGMTLYGRRDPAGWTLPDNAVSTGILDLVFQAGEPEDQVVKVGGPLESLTETEGILRVK